MSAPSPSEPTPPPSSVDAQPEKEDAPAQHMTGLLLAVNVSALLLSLFLTSLDLTIIATALPRITHVFHDLNAVGWYGSAFFLSTSVFMSTWGKIFKFFDLKIAFLCAILIFELGALGSAVTQSSAGFIAGRAVSGVGGAGILGGTYTILAHIVPPKQVPMYYGLSGIVFTLASVAGPLVGGVFTSDVTWRWCFYINLPLGALVGGLLTLFLHLPSTAAPVKATWLEKFLQLDIPGTIAMVGSLVCYLLALQWAGNTKPWSSPDVIGTLVGWILLTMAFVAIEMYQGERALIAPRFLKNRAILVSSVFIFLIDCANYTRQYYLPIYFQAIDGVTPVRSGVLILSMIVTTSAFTLIAGALLGKIGYYQPFYLLGSLLVTIGSGLIYTLDTNTSQAAAIGYQALVGVGNGLVVQVPVTAVQAFTSPSDIPTVTGTVLFCQLISGVYGVAAGESIFTNRLLASLPVYAPGVDAREVLEAGASRLGRVFGPEQLGGVRRAYVVGLRGAWAGTIAFCGAAFLVALVAPRWSVKGRTGAVREREGEGEGEGGEKSGGGDVEGGGAGVGRESERGTG